MYVRAVYIAFDTIRGFRQPLGVWEPEGGPVDRGAAVLHTLLAGLPADSGPAALLPAAAE